MLDSIKLLFDANYRGQVVGLMVERGLPTLLGVFIVIVGIAFILAGSTAGKAVVGVAQLVATKGAALGKGVAK